MTREEMKDFLPIVQAWAEGKTIQYNFDDVWRDVDIDLDLSHDDISKYRIKTEPKYRPFKSKEECWQEMQKHQPFGWIKVKKGGYFCFTMVLDDCSYDDLFKTSTFADGTPFGMKEEQIWQSMRRIPTSTVATCINKKEHKTMSEFEKLKELKVGDKIIVSKRYFGESVNSVTRITNHQILVCGIPYWKENGKEVGGSSYLLIATDERIKQIEDRKKWKDLCAFLNMTRWEDLSIESLTKVVDCVKNEIGNRTTK